MLSKDLYSSSQKKDKSQISHRRNFLWLECEMSVYQKLSKYDMGSKEGNIETSQCIRLFSNMLKTEKLFFSYGAVEVKKKQKNPARYACLC